VVELKEKELDILKEDVLINYRDGTGTATLKIHNICPHCGEEVSPKVFGGYSNDGYRELHKVIGIILRCSREKCRRYYSLEYEYNGSQCKFRESLYRPSIKVELPENIEKVSSAFVEIYSQATVAESEGLDQIAGVGYRKSAEFLIKDYAIRKSPDDEASIKKKLLGAVIKEYLNEFPRIQQLSTAIAWIGNDETHYVRRHDNKDIDDLKRFIKASAQFIAADYDVDEAFEFTSDS